MLNWKVVSPHTLRARAAAVVDFEKTMLVGAADATADDLFAWQLDMQARGLSVNTIRNRLSIVSRVAGIHVPLPKKKKAQPVVLSDDQVKAFFRQIEKETDRELLARLLLTGTTTRTHAHWLSSSCTLTTQELTRKIKRYALMAGLEVDQVNLRTFLRTGRALVVTYSPDYIAENLLPRPVQCNVAWKALHGIGRRSRRTAKV